MQPCYHPGMAGNTKNRVLRVPDTLWEDYGEACEDRGTTRSEALRASMEREVRAFRQRRAMRGATEETTTKEPTK